MIFLFFGKVDLLLKLIKAKSLKNLIKIGIFHETLIVWEIKRFSDKQNTRINYYTRIGSH